MRSDKNAVIAKKLGILWIVLSIVLVFGFIGISTNVAIATGKNLFDVKLEWTCVVLTVEAIILIPLLFLTHYYAKKAKMKKLTIAAKILLAHSLVCTIMLFIFAII